MPVVFLKIVISIEDKLSSTLNIFSDPIERELLISLLSILLSGIGSSVTPLRILNSALVFVGNDSSFAIHDFIKSLSEPTPFFLVKIEL